MKKKDRDLKLFSDFWRPNSPATVLRFFKLNIDLYKGWSTVFLPSDWVWVMDGLYFTALAYVSCRTSTVCVPNVRPSACECLLQRTWYPCRRFDDRRSCQAALCGYCQSLVSNVRCTYILVLWKGWVMFCFIRISRIFTFHPAVLCFRSVRLLGFQCRQVSFSTCSAGAECRLYLIFGGAAIVLVCCEWLRYASSSGAGDYASSVDT